MVTDIFTPGLTAGNPLALPALNHSIVSAGERSFYARVNASLWGPREGRRETGDRGGPAPSPVELASIAHVPATLSIPRIHYAAHARDRRHERPARLSPTSSQRRELRYRYPRSRSSVSMNARHEHDAFIAPSSKRPSSIPKPGIPMRSRSSRVSSRIFSS